MKNVIVSGAAGGIGEVVVKKFIEQQYYVIIIDLDEENGLRVNSQFDNCLFIKMDLLNINSYKLLKDVPIFQRHGVSHLISLAGRALQKEWGEFTNHHFEVIGASIQLNIITHLQLVHTLLPIIEKTEGDRTITLMSSINAQSGYGLPIYSAAKSGMYGFVKSLAPEVGKKGIRINSISPGTVVTPATLNEAKTLTNY